METTRVDVDIVAVLSEQLSWYFDYQARPRLDGLTDEEYHWESAPGSWGIRPRTSADQPGSGDWTSDFEHPAPEPAPVTTIAWRLAHLVVGIFGGRSASHFGARFEQGIADYGSWRYAGSAVEALAQLDATYRAWNDGVSALSEADLARQVGAAEQGWEDHSMAELVVHINREAIHHLAEIALLRDLYAAR